MVGPSPTPSPKPTPTPTPTHGEQATGTSRRNAARARHLVFLGPPGAGKGTQAARLAAERGLAHISTGDMLRAEKAARTPLGIQAEEFMTAGRLVPDQLVIDILLARIQQPPAAPEQGESGWILDGFPRTLPQAEALDERLAASGRPLDRVICFDVAESVLVERIAGRLTCAKCGAVFNEKTSPPRVPGTCDRCGASGLHVRADDRPEAVRQRLASYRAQTEPLIRYYEGRGLLERIDAARDMDTVFDELLRLVS
jgi:adenylate kinase